MCLIFAYDIFLISTHLTRKSSEDRGNVGKIALFIDICLRAYSIIVVTSLFCDIKDANETRSMQAKDDMRPNSSNNNNQHGQHSDRFVIYREAAKSHGNTKF